MFYTHTLHYNVIVCGHVTMSHVTYLLRHTHIYLALFYNVAALINSARFLCMTISHVHHVACYVSLLHVHVTRSSSQASRDQQYHVQL